MSRFLGPRTASHLIYEKTLDQRSPLEIVDLRRERTDVTELAVEIATLNRGVISATILLNDSPNGGVETANYATHWGSNSQTHFLGQEPSELYLGVGLQGILQHSFHDFSKNRPNIRAVSFLVGRDATNTLNQQDASQNFAAIIPRFAIQLENPGVSRVQAELTWSVGDLPPSHINEGVLQIQLENSFVVVRNHSTYGSNIKLHYG
jgi:hypothetical protein